MASAPPESEPGMVSTAGVLLSQGDIVVVSMTEVTPKPFFLGGGSGVVYPLY